MSLKGKMVKLAKYESIRILTPRELEMWNVITLQVDDHAFVLTYFRKNKSKLSMT